jgi:hypothetical protein
MTNVVPINSSSVNRAASSGVVGGVGGVGGVERERPGSAGALSVREDDKVELSEMALYLSKLRELPPERSELIGRVKAEIEAGVYDTPDKLDGTLDELLDDLA